MQTAKRRRCWLRWISAPGGSARAYRRIRLYPNARFHLYLCPSTTPFSNSACALREYYPLVLFQLLLLFTKFNFYATVPFFFFPLSPRYPKLPSTCLLHPPHRRPVSSARPPSRSFPLSFSRTLHQSLLCPLHLCAPFRPPPSAPLDNNGPTAAPSPESSAPS
ncbi:uncharacterized protein BKA78DRAFT_95621 [Phyllosticta capitalensis]|uniref:uncharacterized protein n=1 Tax=Phyllosticta capitalensis TaxID=121624 RepID=UPI00313209B0